MRSVTLGSPGATGRDRKTIRKVVTEAEDECVFVRGIGGRELSLRKRVDGIQFDTYHATNVLLDFGQLAGHEGLNGLIGLDVLEAGRFVIDLDTMEPRSMASTSE